MAFMVPVIEHGAWYVLDGTDGGLVLPADVVGDVTLPDGADLRDTNTGEPPNAEAAAIVAVFADYYGGTLWEVERQEGWGSRLSAPGYMDCTDWTLHKSETEAREYLRETHDVCPYTGDDLPPEDGADCDCMLCSDAEPSPGSCTQAHRLCSHDGASCATRCNCGECFGNPAAAESGYTLCKCRDCMETAVSNDMANPDYCNSCQGVCGPEHTTSAECQADGAYGGETEGGDNAE